MKDEHIIDATDKSLGRVASQAAHLLNGKHRTDFARNTVAPSKVSIINASKAKMDAKKRLNTTHAKYTGYPGGLSTPSNDIIISKKGYSELFRLAVSGMLPKNKLRAKMMKNLKISE